MFVTSKINAPLATHKCLAVALFVASANFLFLFFVLQIYKRKTLLRVHKIEGAAPKMGITACISVCEGHFNC